MLAICLVSQASARLVLCWLRPCFATATSDAVRWYAVVDRMWRDSQIRTIGGLLVSRRGNDRRAGCGIAGRRHEQSTMC
ncbi:hypothetical protein Micbo1qcDRAFT_169307, partial [Microdochium bolleyi]